MQYKAILKTLTVAFTKQLKEKAIIQHREKKIYNIDSAAKNPIDSSLQNMSIMAILAKCTGVVCIHRSMYSNSYHSIAIIHFHLG